MFTVAQQRTVPMPVPRTRFNAVAIGRQSPHMMMLGPRLRSLGAASVHESPTARLGAAPRPSGPGDVAVLVAPDTDVREELRSLAATGWRRVVVVAPHLDQARIAIRCGARSVVVPPPSGQPVATPATVPSPGRAAVGQRGMAEDLSDREIQVLQRVADGHSNRQIGDDLCLSALTVKSHLARIARKLGTGDRAEMVAIGIRSGVVA